MRRPTTRTALRAAAAALALSLTLAACAGDGDGGSADPTPTSTSEETPAPEENPTPTAEDIAALEAVTVEGDAGAEPTVTLPSTPFTVSAQVARLVDEGSGDAIAEGDLIELHSVWLNGKDGSKAASSWENGAPEQIIVNSTTLAAAISDLLVGGNVGLRFAYAYPGGDEGAQVAVAEVAAKRPGRAVGTPVEPADGLPTVELQDNGLPLIKEFVNGPAPTELVVQPLIEGEGPVVESGQTITVHYTGWLWDGKQFDSSWERGTPFPVENIGAGGVIAGWNEGLVGQKVGSQVMLVVPPDKGYGEEGSGETIPGGSTLVFVVDILAAR